MDAQFRELQTKTSRSMAQLKGQFRAASRDANTSLGGIGKGGGGLLGNIGGKLAGRALGRTLGVGDELASTALRGAGSFIGGTAGTAISGAAGAISGTKLITGWAQESGRIDDAALAAMRYGDAINKIVPSLSQVFGFVKDIAITGMGAANTMGELVASRFNTEEVNAYSDAMRGAIEQEAALAKLRADNDPAKLRAVRGAITGFQRDQRFAGASPKGQQGILSDEIALLKTKEDAARSNKKILDAETLKLERIQKEAELAKSIADLTDEQRRNEEAITLSRLKRMDRADEEARNEEAKKFSDAQKLKVNGLTDQLKKLGSNAPDSRNPFSRPVVNGFGSATNDPGSAFRAGELMRGKAEKDAKGNEDRIQMQILAVLNEINLNTMQRG
jgi:hypothetical protein